MKTNVLNHMMTYWIMLFISITLHGQTFNYGTGNVAGNAAPFASGDANVTVAGNDVTVTGNTTMTAGTYNFANFTINAGVTITVTGTGSPLIIRCTGAFENYGTLSVNGANGSTPANGTTAANPTPEVTGIAGGANGGRGGGPSSNGTSNRATGGFSFGTSTGGGRTPCNTATYTVPSWGGPGGGGGVYAITPISSNNGTNGAGQGTGCAQGGGAGTATYGNATLTAQVGAASAFFSAGQTAAGDRWLLGGSGGAGGAGTQSIFGSARAAGGSGGTGGGAVQIAANSIYCGPSGIIRARGGNGGNGNLSSSSNAAGGGGGAGSGGTINLQYMSSYVNDNANTTLRIDVRGGIGGFGPFGTTGTGGDGGAGGAGRSLIEQDEMLCTPPSGAATAFNASNITTNSATINWTRGNGDEVIVIVREGAAVAGGPVSGNTYTANSDFTLGQILGGGRVVYIGDGTSVNVSNLPNLNTTYHVAVFEFFTANDGCYQLAGTQLTGDFTTSNGPMTYVSSTNVQQTGSSPLASTNQPILRLEVVGGPGTSPALTMNSITFNTTGTTSASDLTGARIFYTGSSNSFATTTPFGSTVNNPSGTHVVNGNQDLVPGTNYFWLVYDVSIAATVGNVMDAQITAINVGSNETPIETNPAGNRVITSLMNLSCGYSFQHFTPTWTSNVGQSGTTVVASGAASIDDQRWPGQNFDSGFNFEYNGQVYNQFGIHSKGFIWFGNTTPSGLTSTPISSALGYDGAIAPFAFDMVAHSSSSTTPQVTVRYTGTAPNRVCIIEWTAMRPWNNTGGLCPAFGSPTDWNRYDFQLHLYEDGGTNANRIEFVHRDMSAFCVNANSANAQVGLRGPNNSDFLNRQGSGNTAHTASSAGTLNNQVIAHGGNNFFNGNGGMRFTPTFQKPVVSPFPTAENTCPDETVELSTTSPVAIKQWFNNNLPIAGANGSNYTASASGTHLLVVSQGACSKVSDAVAVTITPCNTCVTVFGVDKIETCDPIVWIDGNTYSSNNNTATFLLVGASQDGCDSLVTLNLTFWPCTKLQPSDCGATNVTMDQTLRAININMPAYRFHVTGPNNGGPGWVNGSFIYDSPNRSFKFTNIPGSYWGQTYTVLVAPGDGLGDFGAYGDACTVSLGDAPTNQLQASDCGVTVAQNVNLTANQITGAQGYRFRIIGNNTASWANNTFIITKNTGGGAMRKFKMNEAPGTIWGETYTVEVAIQDAAGNWGNYGNACNVTIAVPSTNLQASFCNIVNVLPTTSLQAVQITGNTGYLFRITGPNNASWPNDQFLLERPNRSMKFTMVPGWMQGEEYTVEVSVKDASNVYVPFGAPCTVTMVGLPDFVINDNIEMIQTRNLTTVEFGVNASHNPFTHEFALSIIHANDSDLSSEWETIHVNIYDMSGKLIASSALNPMDLESTRFGSNLASGMYIVEVKQGSNQAVIRQIKN